MAASPPTIPAPSRLEALGSLRNSNVDVAFATAFVTLTTGAFLVGLVQKFGGSAFVVNLLAAIPSLMGILQIPGAIYGRGLPSYKPFLMWCGVFWRLLYLPLIALPLLNVSPAVALVVLVACVTIGSASNVFGSPVYNDWIAEMVPANSRGFFFSKRNAIASAVGAIVGFAGGKVLDIFRAQGLENLGFSVIFALAILCSIASISYFLRMRDLPRTNVIRQSVFEGIKAVRAPFFDRNFRRVLLFLAMAVIGQGFAGNLFTAFAFESLKLNYTVLLGAGLMYAAGGIAALKLWGYVSDKYGNRPLLLILCAALALNPVPWILCIPGKPTYDTILLLSTHVLMGVTWSGLALCQFNLLLATAKPEDRANYIAAGLATSSLIGGMAPLMGAALFTALHGAVATAIAYKLVFGTAAVLRLISALFLIPVKEEGSSDVKQTLRVLGGMTPRGILAMRGLARGIDVDSREAAIHNVGAAGVGLASDEVIKALHDPLPRVRRQAAATLTKLNDPRATAALVHMIEDHPDLVEEETVVALGYLGDPEAIPALTRTLQSPKSLLRRAAARALGRIGHEESTDSLIQAAMEPNDPDLRRAALQALRLIGSHESEGAAIAGLDDQHPSVRIAAAELVAELELRGAADALRASLAKHHDEASSEVAYALGAVGIPADIPAILDEAAVSVSMITRRRCLLGVAHILGVEEDVYRLLLLEGMARDTALLEMTRGAVRQNREFAVALELFSTGEEPAALIALVQASPLPELQALSAKPVAELFLVAVVYALQK